MYGGGGEGLVENEVWGGAEGLCEDGVARGDRVWVRMRGKGL